MNQRQRDHLQWRLRSIARKTETETRHKYEVMRNNVRKSEYPNIDALSTKAKVEQIKKGTAKMKKKSDIQHDANSDGLSSVFTFAELSKTERAKLQTEMNAKLQQLREEEKAAVDKLDKKLVYVMDAAILGDDKTALKSIQDFQKFCEKV